MESAFKEQFLQSKMEVQEAVMAIVSKELHENIGQLLSSTKMLIGLAERELTSLPDTLKTAGETLSKAICELRSLSKSMSKDWLEQFDLLDNLKAEVNRINSGNGKRLQLTTPEKIFLKSEEQIILFRIIKETIQHFITQVNARNVFINLIDNDERLVIKIQGDNKECDSEMLRNNLVLVNITQRTQILGGTISSQMAIPGCLVQIQIPYTKTEVCA